MKASTSSKFSLAAFASLLLTITAFAQGPLAPPGSPAPSMKSLGEVDARVATAGERIPLNSTTCPGDAGSQFIIAQSGSYFLPGNIAVSDSVSGITINASNVTLDLNGYDVTGPGQAGLNGIAINGDHVTVRNGRSVRWENGFLTNGQYTVFEQLIAASNSGTGFNASNGLARFDVCSASYNIKGFYAGFASQFIACGTDDNSFCGFDISGGSRAENCTSVYDRSGFVLNGPGDIVRDCAASQFGFSGFNVTGGGSAVYKCSVSTDSGGAVFGFRVGGPSSLVVDCTSQYSGDSSGGLTYGFDGAGAIGAIFLRCSATGWSGAGFSMDSATSVSGCNAVSNGGDGIVFSNRCAVTGNTVSQNGGEGLSATDIDNRVEGNTATNNIVSGIRSYDSSNVVVRNVSRNNSVDYNPAASVNTGPTGQTPGGAITSPWANF